MNRVMIISYSFPPSNAPAAQRPYTIAKYLSRENYRVSVLSCSNQDSSLGIAEKELPADNFKHHKVPGFSLTWFRKRKTKLMAVGNDKDAGLPQSKVNRTVRWIFPDKAISWFPFALIWCLFHPHKFIKATVLTTSPLATNHLLGLFVKSIYRSRWIADFRDFHYLNNYDQYPDSLNSKLHAWLEKKVIAKANNVTFISETMCNIYTKNYPKEAKKFKTIYNGFDPEDYYVSRAKEHIDFIKKPVRIFYAGSFYRGVRSPLPLINALQVLVDSGIIAVDEIVIEVAGNFEKELLVDIARYPISKQINFLGKLPRNSVLALMQKAHLLWLIVGEEVTHYAGIPVKAFEYVASGRPILCFDSNGTETPNMIKELNAGWILSNKPEDNDSNSEILNQIFSKMLYAKAFNSKKLEDNVRYNRKAQALKFGELISSGSLHV